MRFVNKKRGVKGSNISLRLIFDNYTLNDIPF